MFVSAGVNLKFHCWPLEVSQEIQYKPQGSGNVTALSLSKDNSFLSFACENGNPEIISLKDPDKIKIVHTISAVADTSILAFQRTTKRFIGLGTHSGQVALYDTKQKLISKLLQGASGAVNLLDFNVGDNNMAVSCANGAVLLYDVRRGNICQTYVASNTHSPSAMLFHPMKKHILAAGIANGTVMEWDINTGVRGFCTQIHSASVTDLIYLPKTNMMLSVGLDHKFCIHDSNYECVFRSNHQHALTAVDVSSDGLNVVLGSEPGDISIYDSRKLMTPIQTWKAHSTKINKILYEHQEKYDSKDTFEDPIANSQKHQEIIIKQSNKLEKLNTNKPEMQYDAKIPCERKCGSEKEFKRTQDKTQLTPDKTKPNETISLNFIKREFLDTIQKSANELQTHLLTQFESFHNFVANEFRTIDAQMEEKWDILNVTKNASVKNMHTPDEDFTEY